MMYLLLFSLFFMAPLQLQAIDTQIRVREVSWQKIKDFGLRHKGKLLFVGSIGTIFWGYSILNCKLAKYFVDIYDKHSIDFNQFTKREQLVLTHMGLMAYLYGVDLKAFFDAYPARAESIGKSLDEIAKNSLWQGPIGKIIGS